MGIASVVSWGKYSEEDLEADKKTWGKWDEDRDTWQKTAEDWWAGFQQRIQLINAFSGCTDYTPIVLQYLWGIHLPTKEETLSVCKYFGEPLVRQVLVRQWKMGDDPIDCFFQIPKIALPGPIADDAEIGSRDPMGGFHPHKNGLKQVRIPQLAQMESPVVRFQHPDLGPALAVLHQHLGDPLKAPVLLEVVYGMDRYSQKTRDPFEIRTPSLHIFWTPTDQNKRLRLETDMVFVNYLRENLADFQRFMSHTRLCSINQFAGMPIPLL